MVADVAQIISIAANGLGASAGIACFFGTHACSVAGVTSTALGVTAAAWGSISTAVDCVAHEFDGYLLGRNRM